MEPRPPVDVVLTWSCEAVLKSGAGSCAVGRCVCFEHEDQICRSLQLLRVAGRAWGEPGGDGGDQRLLARAVLSAGGPVRDLAGECPRVKHVPGRPKTDRLDAVCLCKV